MALASERQDNNKIKSINKHIGFQGIQDDTPNYAFHGLPFNSQKAEKTET